MKEYFERFAFRRPSDSSDRNREYECYESFYFYPALTSPSVFYDAETGAQVIKRTKSVDW